MYNTELCSNYNGSNRGLVVSIHDLHAAGHGFTRFARTGHGFTRFAYSGSWVHTICTQRVMGSNPVIVNGGGGKGIRS